MAQTEERAQRSLRALLAMGHILATTSPYERVVAGMIATVSDVLDVETCGFFLHDPDRDELVLQRPGFDAYDEAVFEYFHIPLSRPGPTRQVFLTGRPALVNNALDPSSPWFQGSRMVNARRLMVVPLMTEGRGIGVLSITNKRTGNFEPDDLELAMLLAPHLALTIDAAAKHQKLEHQQQQLERALQVHAELSKAIVSAPDVGPLAESLARLLRRPVLLVDSGLQSIAHAAGPAPTLEREMVEAAARQALTQPHVDLTDVASLRLRAQVGGDRVDFVAATIAAGDHLEGYVAVVEAGSPLDVVDVRALEHAATLFAFQLLRERTALEVERRVRGELFQELLSTAHSTDRGSAALLERLGASATGPWRVVRLELARDDAAGVASGSAFDPRIAAALATAWTDTGLGAPLAPWGSGFASVIPDTASTRDDCARLTANLRDALAIAAPELHFVVALGSRAASPRQLTDSFQQAEDALGLALRLQALDRAVRFEELGIERVLLDSIDTSTSHESFVQQVLGPLLAYDVEHHRDLLATLKEYVDAGYAPRPAARRLFIHVNTLRFRLKRIADLLGGEWPNGQVRFQVELALRLLDLQAIRARQHARARIAPRRGP